ncbi:hypothetical protein [Nocardia stercoris]|uniref:Ig-like domain repeat protein n=1 Tax=Nocardia stercoris TaxID=2483361 RepID=A0A3M2LC51_9NOCA|nr:hypothetical protein [Nocardia stercoris]RMI32258.1 hypothetical protein EBN03_14820 [Nocardia stercoris]
MNIRLRGARIAVAATALGAAALAIASTAPAASADITSVSVSSGLGIGGAGVYGTGCQYTVTATVNSDDSVYFYDNLTGFLGMATSPAYGTAQVSWTPVGPGVHTLSAVQFSYWGVASRNIQVQVAPGLNFGSVCLAL